jgi:glycogen synthase
MFAMRYGTIPIARATGGLKDTVIDFESGGTGISFTHDTPHDLSQDKTIAQNYSWEASTKTYISTYNRITQ